SPFDKDRKRTFEAATKLLLTPGISQIYYGDESARDLTIEGAEGDATLRSNMNWNDLQNNAATQKLEEHYQKLGKFRADHPAVGAGVHQNIGNNAQYWFSRNFTKDNLTDRVVVGLDLPKGEKMVNLGGIFPAGTRLRDAYSGKTTVV